MCPGLRLGVLGRPLLFSGISWEIHPKWVPIHADPDLPLRPFLGPRGALAGGTGGLRSAGRTPPPDLSEPVSPSTGWLSNHVTPQRAFREN